MTSELSLEAPSRQVPHIQLFAGGADTIGQQGRFASS